LFVIHCVAPEETTRKRLAERALAGKDISDGRWEIYRQQAAAYQAIDEIPPDHSLELNTEPALEELARVSERFLRSRRAPGSST
jgi:predicted kinase